MAITFPRELPAGIKFEASRFGLNVNQSVFSSDISRKKQVQQHAGGLTDRWEGVFTTPRLSPAAHAELSAWLISLRGQEGTFLAGNPDNKRPRSGTLGNLLTANSLVQVSSAGVTFNSIMGLRPLHLFDLKPGDIVSGESQVKSTAGLDRIQSRLSFYNADRVFIGGVSGSEVTSSTFATSSFTNQTIIANTSFLVWQTGNLDTTETATVKDSKLNRGATSTAVIATVMGASQTGRALTVQRLPTATINIFLVGDYFTLEGVLYRLTEDIDSDGSGQATLAFEPALKTSPADNAQLLFENTTTTCRLVSNVAAWETDHLKTGPISFAWEEVI